MEKTTIASLSDVRLADDAPTPLKGLKALVMLALVVGALAAGYQATRTPVTLVIDGQAQRMHTHQDTVAALLMDIGLPLTPKDMVIPGPDTPLEPKMTVKIQRARPVYVSADGHQVMIHTHATSVEAVLQEVRVSLGPYDEVEVKGELATDCATCRATGTGGSAALASRSLDRRSGSMSATSGFSTAPQPPHIIVHRAMPFTLHEEGQAKKLYTTASTVGETLWRAGVTLYLADGVEPGLGERMRPDMHIHIDLSIPVTVQVDGRTLRTRTHRQQVSEVLADLGVVLTGQDYTIPPVDASLEGNARIQVVRVSERFVIEQEPLPFETVWQPDPDLEIDHQRVLQEGARGVLERRIRIRYEDGHEVSRTLDSEYVAVPPKAKIFGYGTKIVVRAIDTPSGPVEYWRVIRMLATSYSAGTAGTPKSSPWYGRTATGMKMRHGIVAVDPRVVNLRSNVYVPGYGVGIAGDTGGSIKGRRIDLGYDDDNLELWYRWVDVYLLTPVPPTHQINYLLGP